MGFGSVVSLCVDRCFSRLALGAQPEYGFRRLFSLCLSFYGYGEFAITRVRCWVRTCAGRPRRLVVCL